MLPITCTPAIITQDPKHLRAEAAYLKATLKEGYEFFM
jgi:hypothetical protein